MMTFTKMLQGSENGSVVAPGKPDESQLIKKLKGTGGGERMPRGKPPLADDVIAKFEKWIAEGAKFDAPDANQPLPEVVAIVQAKNATHEELSKIRAGLAAKNWRTFLPDAEPNKYETENFLLYGNVGPETLTDVGRVAEEQLVKLRPMLKMPSGPFVKGRMTLYVFDSRVDYSEVGNVLEHRQIPQEWRGHWRFSIVDAYGCVVPPKAGESGLGPLVAQQIAGVFIASQGKMPRWFSEGSARAIAARLDPKDARVHNWEAQLAEAISESEKPDDFLTGKLNPELSDVLSYSFVKSLMGSGAKYQAVLAGLHSGAPFDQAFAKAFGTTPNQIAMNWSPRAISKRGK